LCKILSRIWWQEHIPVLWVTFVFILSSDNLKAPFKRNTSKSRPLIWANERVHLNGYTTSFNPSPHPSLPFPPLPGLCFCLLHVLLPVIIAPTLWWCWVCLESLNKGHLYDSQCHYGSLLKLLIILPTCNLVLFAYKAVGRGALPCLWSPVSSERSQEASLIPLISDFLFVCCLSLRAPMCGVSQNTQQIPWQSTGELWGRGVYDGVSDSKEIRKDW